MTIFRSSLIALLTVCAFAGHAAAALAKTFNVNSIFDVVASPPLDNGVCETAPGNGVCTLRAAIMKANHFPGGGVTINVPANAVPYKITTAPVAADDEGTGDLDITAAMTLVGAGVGATIIDGNGLDRVFTINTPAPITISGVTIRNGTANVGGGGGILINSFPFGTLVLTDSAITGSSGFHGGAIFSLGATLTLSRVTLSGNAALYQGGGIYNDGASGSTTVTDSIISDNVSGTLGGGLSLNSTGVISRSVISGNSAGDNGGGISTYGITLLVTDSTIHANQSAANGGGISSGGTSVTIENSTISANGAHANGGGIFQQGASGFVRLFHVTLGGNVADSDSVGGGMGGGGIYRESLSGPNELWNSLLVENFAGSVMSDCGGGLNTSQDYNYLGSLGGCTLVGTLTHNIVGGDPWLDGLRHNGGPTPTRALFSSSPAIDTIPSALCRDSFGVAPQPDQRGVVRPVGPQCDMGSYEGSKSTSQLGRNLIRNGDAENSAGSMTGALVGEPAWSIFQGSLTVVPYGSPGGFPVVTDAVPANHGYNFFAGGPGGTSGASQTIDVASVGAAIDAGQITFDMAGDFGGFGNQDDSAALVVVFRDGSFQQIGGFQRIGDVVASDRNNATGFLHRSASGPVPAGTREIVVTLQITRAVPAYNDGYADNLSLVLSGGATAPVLQKAVTRKAHGGAGTFNLQLN